VIIITISLQTKHVAARRADPRPVQTDMREKRQRRGQGKIEMNLSVCVAPESEERQRLALGAAGAGAAIAGRQDIVNQKARYKQGEEYKERGEIDPEIECIAFHILQAPCC